MTDAEGVILFTNPAEDRMFGYERGELTGKHISIEYAGPVEESNSRISEVARQLHLSGRWEGEWSNKRKDGVPFYTRARITEVVFQGREYWVRVQEDITDRRRAQSAAMHLAAIVESSSDAIVSKDLNGIVTSWNRGAERLFGYTASEMVGQPITRLALPERLDEMPAILARLRRGERLDHYETLRRHKDGKTIAVSLTVSPVRNAKGEIIGASKIARDITEQKKLREDLFDRERQLRNLVSNLPDVVSRFSPDLRFSFISPAVEQLTGQPADFFVGKSHEQAGLPPELGRLLAHSVRHVFETGESHRVEFDFDSPVLGPRRLYGVAVPEIGFGGGVESVLSIVRDITDIHRSQEAQKAVEQELMLLVEASGTLLASPHSGDVQTTIVQLAQRFIAADAHAVWRQNEEGMWRLVSSSGLSVPYVTYASKSVPSSSPAPAAPMIVPDVAREDALKPRAGAMQAEGIRSLLAIPLWMQGGPAGTLTFYWRSPHAISNAEVRISTALANLAAAALTAAELYERQTASRERAESSERRAALLAEAGAVLSSSLDYQTTLANVAKLAVPGFADWCAVDLLHESGIERVTTYHSDPDKIAFSDDLRRKYPPRDDDSAVAAIRSGRSVLVERFAPETLRDSARDSEHLKLLLELGIRSVIVAPMMLGSKSLGGLTFVSAESGRRYTAADLRLAEELARRAAFAVAHARLYSDLQTNEQRLRLAVEAAGLGVWEHDLASGELACSEQGKRNVGADPDQPLDFADLTARIHPDDRPRWAEAMKRAREENTALESEYRIRFPDGNYHWVLAYGRCVYDKDGVPVRTVGVSMNITERKRTEEALRLSNDELKRANDDLNQFAYSASHDLQEPLRMVSLYSQLLGRSYAGRLDETADEYIGYVLQGSRRLENLIKDLLAYTRAINISTDVEAIDTDAVLMHALQNLTARIEENEAVVTHGALPSVRIQDIHLLQIFQNLIGNAIKYRKVQDPPRVHVACTVEGGMYKFSVTDNGIGIPREYSTQVFGIFKRLHTSEKYSGTGIGLAICQRIVERYGGRIWVESEVGQGSVFYFTLPL